MNSPMVSYGCTALMGTNKRGTLKCDADGYYTVVLGALNHFNNNNQFYPLAPAKPLFDSSASLMRRIASGNLRGECGHPRPMPGMSERDYMGRLNDIYEPNVAFHIRKVWFVEGERDEAGRPITLIMGEVRPSGPRGPALKDQLENRFEDTCFSIRAFCIDTMVGGRFEKHLRQIVTWDWVNEPGISAAHKWRSPALESLSDFQLSRETVLVMAQQESLRSVAMESDRPIARLVEAMGWNVQQPRPRSDAW